MASAIGSEQSSVAGGQWVDERNAFISWLRGEFAAANAMIDALCQHLQLLGSPSEYDLVLSCINQRRYNWNSVLYMQHYYSIAEVLVSLQQVAYTRKNPQALADGKPAYEPGSEVGEEEEEDGRSCELVLEESKAAEQVIANGSTTKHVAGKESGHLNSSSVDAFEEVDGKQVNVLEGLEVHENVFDAQEASRIAAMAGESHAAKKKKNSSSGGEKQQQQQQQQQRSPKVKAKEVIHFGTIPSEIVTSSEKPPEEKVACTEERAEQMPAFLESIIDRLVTSRVVPASKRPDSCSISLLEQGDYMPPHKHSTFEQPLFILSLGSQSELAFGRNLKTKPKGEPDEGSSGKYKVLLPVGSVLVLQGKSSELVQCSVSPSQSTRTLITFGKMVKKKPPAPAPAQAPVAPVSPVSPTGSTSSLSNGAASFVPARLQSSPPAPILVPVPAQLPMIVSSIGAYTPVTVVGPGWSTTPPRVPSPGTGVFFPAKGSGAHHHNNNPHHHMNGSHRRLAAAQHHAGHHFENATAVSNGHVMAAAKEVAA